MALLSMLGTGTVAQAKVFRCEFNGRMVFTDRPCADIASDPNDSIKSPAPASDAPLPALSAPVAKAQTTTPPPRLASPAQLRPAAGPTTSTSMPGKRVEHAEPGPAPRWRLVGKYSDRVPDPEGPAAGGARRTVTRSSFGIVCEDGERRINVYAIDRRFSLATPDKSGRLESRGEIFGSLEDAAAAACAAAHGPNFAPNPTER